MPLLALSGRHCLRASRCRDVRRIPSSSPGGVGDAKRRAINDVERETSARQRCASALRLDHTSADRVNKYSNGATPSRCLALVSPLRAGPTPDFAGRATPSSNAIRSMDSLRMSAMPSSSEIVCSAGNSPPPNRRRARRGQRIFDPLNRKVSLHLVKATGKELRYQLQRVLEPHRRSPDLEIAAL